jgi:SAM-dependent methyltransferase
MKTLKKIVRKCIYLALSPFVLKDYFAFKKSLREQSRNSNATSSPYFPSSHIRIRDFKPRILDKTVKTGFDAHYVYHTSWAARKVREINPARHVDISSSLYFSGIVSAFIAVDFYDYRPAELKLSGLTSAHADLNTLHFATESVPSLSCMHTVEHIGLGRYGDTIDAQGDLKAIAELKRVVTKKGSLLFVVPVGEPKIEFNAHRIYSYEQVMEYFGDGNFILKEFSLITDEGNFLEHADLAIVAKQKYACGCFWFIKR